MSYILIKIATKNGKEKYTNKQKRQKDKSWNRY